MNRPTKGFARALIGVIAAGTLSLTPASAALATPSMPSSHSAVQILDGRGSGSSSGTPKSNSGRNVTPPRNSGGNSAKIKSPSSGGRNVQAPSNSGGGGGKSANNSVKTKTVTKATVDPNTGKVTIPAGTRTSSHFTVGNHTYTTKNTRIYYNEYHGGYPPRSSPDYIIVIHDNLYYPNYLPGGSYYGQPYPTGVVLRNGQFYDVGHSAWYYLMWTLIVGAIIIVALVVIVRVAGSGRRRRRFDGGV